MKLIEKYFKLHPLTVEDCLTPDTREKFEVFEGYEKKKERIERKGKKRQKYETNQNDN